MILLLESSADVCSVGLEKHGVCQHVIEEIGLNHAEKLASFVHSILTDNQVDESNLEAIAISAGPGSYTGLRIGASLAKGMCYAYGKPMIAVSTLESLFSAGQTATHDFFIPMIDARRMEVYASVFDQKGRYLEDEKPVVLNKSSFTDYSAKNTLILGKGAEKFNSLGSGFDFNTELNFSAKHLASIARQKFTKSNFVDLAYYEPNYIKSFQAIKAKPTF